MSHPAIAFRAGVAVAAWLGVTVNAQVVPIPNASFESPTTTYAGDWVDSWEENPKPPDYEELYEGEWDTKVGIFLNPPPESPDDDHIDNLDGNQALFLFAVPGAGVSLDYHSIDYNDEVAPHDFDATFDPGKGYQLTIGVIGGGTVGAPMIEGVPLELSLYYHDEQTNVVAVATKTITYNIATFPTATHFVDFQLRMPIVNADDPWAGKRIGIGIDSTVSEEMQGSYWDLDNVRLVAIPGPTLVNPEMTDDGFTFTVQSVPGTEFDLLASSDLALPIGEWPTILSFTNETGTVSITNNLAGAQRFYQLQQLP